MVADLVNVMHFFVMGIPTLIYTILIPSIILAEIQHQLLPEEYPNNRVLKYLDEKL